MGDKGKIIARALKRNLTYNKWFVSLDNITKRY